MSEEKIASIVKEFIDAFVKKDIEKALSFFTEDASWTGNEGTFKGKSELKRYMTWSVKLAPDLKITEAGIGLLVKGNIAVHEFDEEATYEGKKYEMRAVAICEFKGEKIQNLRTISDRLMILKQTVKGWMATRTVNSIVNGMEKGLH